MVNALKIKNLELPATFHLANVASVKIDFANELSRLERAMYFKSYCLNHIIDCVIEFSSLERAMYLK